LATLAESVPSSANAESYARIVRRAATLREAQYIAGEVARDLVAPDGDPSDILAAAANDLQRLAREADRRNTPAPLNAAALCQKYPTLREPLIDGLLRRAEVGNLVAPPKAHKSYALLHLGICIATGRPWLGFSTHRGRVLLLDFELHGETLGHRLPVVLAAERLTPADLCDGLAVELRRGRPLDIYTLGSYLAALESLRFSLVVIDPLYRLFPADMDENDNADIAKVYAMLAGYADKLNAAIIVVHHLSKGPQGEKGLTDLGAGGGAQSRAADAHLSLREHAEPGAAVLAGVVRSFPPVEPVALRWEYPLWHLAPDLDPADLKRSGSRGRKNKTEPTEPLPPPWTPERFATVCLTDAPRTKEVVLANAVASGVKNEHRASRLLAQAEAVGKAHRWTLPKDRRTYFANRKQPILEAGE
jgi:hypothetical protein